MYPAPYRLPAPPQRSAYGAQLAVGPVSVDAPWWAWGLGGIALTVGSLVLLGWVFRPYIQLAGRKRRRARKPAP